MSLLVTMVNCTSPKNLKILPNNMDSATPPHYPQGNSLAERTVEMLKA